MMLQRTKVLVVSGTLICFFSACADTGGPVAGPDKQGVGTVTGAVSGAGSGAIIGAQLTAGAGPGAAVGAGFGAILGALKGAGVDPFRKK